MDLLPDDARNLLPSTLREPTIPPDGHKRRSLKSALKNYTWENEDQEEFWENVSVGHLSPNTMCSELSFVVV